MQLLSFMHLTFHLLCYLETHLPPAQTIKCQLCSLQSPGRPVGLHNQRVGVRGGECQAFLYILHLQTACFIHHGPFLWSHSLSPSLICSSLRDSTCSSKGWTCIYPSEISLSQPPYSPFFFEVLEPSVRDPCSTWATSLVHGIVFCHVLQSSFS